MKHTVALSVFFASLLPVTALAQCHEEVHIGDTYRQVIEKCGQPKWRERSVKDPAGKVEVIKELNSTMTIPVNPEVREKWYYVTGQDKTTVIEILDSGVLSVRELIRNPDEPANME